MPPLGTPAGPLPANRRYVFTPADYRWSGSLTLGELLLQVPGVFVVRAGWFGQPEHIAYAGQGGASVEIEWDGFRLENIGADSLAFDLNRFDIGLFSRIEVEALPTVLRVHLISDTQRARRARTEVTFSTGDASTNQYRLRYLNRWANGFGMAVGVSFFGTQGPTSSPGEVNDLGLWTKFTWMPSDRVGVEYQYASDGFQREPLPSVGTGAGLLGLDARRWHSFVRMFAATGTDGYGLRADATVGTMHASDTSGYSAAVGQAALALSWRTRSLSLTGTARQRDGSAPLALEARGAWSPLRPVTVTAGLRQGRYLGDDAAGETDVGVELRPLLLLGARDGGLTGSVRLWADARQHPGGMVTPGQPVPERGNDWSTGVGFSSRTLTLDVGVGLHDAYDPPGFGILSGAPGPLPSLTTTEATTVTLRYRLAPVRWLALQGWVRDPTASPYSSFEPPMHSLTRLVFRSGFLPHFRRGAFDVMAQLEVEAWGDGVAAIDGSGNPIALQGRSILNGHVQVRLGSAIFYWTLRNIQLERYEIVPGFEMPRAQQRFGLLWEFVN